MFLTPYQCSVTLPTHDGLNTIAPWIWSRVILQVKTAKKGHLCLEKSAFCHDCKDEISKFHDFRVLLF